MITVGPSNVAPIPVHTNEQDKNLISLIVLYFFSIKHQLHFLIFEFSTIDTKAKKISGSDKKFKNAQECNLFIDFFNRSYKVCIWLLPIDLRIRPATHLVKVVFPIFQNVCNSVDVSATLNT